MAYFFTDPTHFAVGAIVGAAAFAGVGIHSSNADVHSLLKLSPSAAVTFFHALFPRAKTVQIATLLLSIIDASGAAYFTQGLTRNLFIAGAIINAIVFPYTGLALVPINNQILAIKPAEADSAAMELIKKWGQRNWVRPILTSISLCLFTYGLFTMKSK
jgi:hypothetical protein